MIISHGDFDISWFTYSLIIEILQQPLIEHLYVPGIFGVPGIDQ